MTCNKSSVSLTKEKSLFTRELIPVTVTSKTNKAHKKIKKLFYAVRLKENTFNVLDEKAFRLRICSTTTSVTCRKMKQVSKSRPHPQLLQEKQETFLFL